MSKSIALSQALSAKLCHDLAGSIGSLDNCLSLIDNKDPSIGVKAKELVFAESANLVKKIKFYRAAYAFSEGESKMSLVMLESIIREFFAKSKINFIFNHDQGVIFIDIATSKAVLCLSAIASESMVSGGDLELFIPESNNKPILIRGLGKRIALKYKTINILTDSEDSPVTATNCREHYIRAICNERGYTIDITKNEALLEIKMNKK